MDTQITDAQITLLKQLSKKINKTITNYKCSKKIRKRKTRIIDAVAFKLLYGENKSTQHSATADLNMFLNISNKKEMLSRVSLIEKEDNVSIDLYKNISICLDEFIKQLNYKSFKHHIYAVDGTNVTMDKEHSKHGYPSNQNPHIAFGYIMGLYDITLNAPITLDLCKNG